MLEAVEPRVLFASFVVTTAADAGAGSLRQAILDAELPCSNAPCRVVFRLPPPVPESGWFTIHPESPLPPLHGLLSIDATPQLTAEGPGIEIRGDRQPWGDGITIDGACESLVTGLALNGFPGHAVSISGNDRLCPGALYPPFVVSRNVIGLDPPGRTPVPNYRGVYVAKGDTTLIANNRIGGNRRSAIFVWGGRVVDIRENIIGLTRDGAPAPNGASGIYVNSFSSAITDNVIANSGEFGIAVSANAPAIHINHNRIFDNGLTAIDIGLDLETPNGADLQGAIFNHPVLFSAHYDAAADKTTVRGRFDTSRSNGSFTVEFYASGARNARGHAQAERLVGELRLSSAHTDFECAADGDLTGQWIAATATLLDALTIIRDQTSELSDPVQVTP